MTASASGPTRVLPGGTLGVFGGGQLGRMLGLAARNMGYRFAVLSDDADGPAAQVADQVAVAAYDDEEAVAEFARSVDAVSFEFENVPSVAGEVASRWTAVRPDVGLLHAVQDRTREKRALERLGLPLPAFRAIASEDDLAEAARAIPGAGVLKTSSFGYDGKGQVRVESAEGLGAAWASIGRVPAVLEALVPFVDEISVVVARGVDGDLAVYEPFSNAHANHILDVTVCPADLDEDSLAEAHRIARAVAEGFDVVGVLCIEMFRLEDGTILVNEIAPRPHNSGHLTIDAHACSQFEQQARAVAGLPLGSSARIGPPAAMANLLGDLWADGTPRWDAALALPGVSLHLYGKKEARPGRKMGHLTAVAATPAEAAALARRARAALTAPPA
ncbi:MAG: 5-(carboxyamino)imidazole ribonucleotide synthase [Planctomycetota bacterium]